MTVAGRSRTTGAELQGSIHRLLQRSGPGGPGDEQGILGSWLTASSRLLGLFPPPRNPLFQSLAPYRSDRHPPMDPQISEIMKGNRGRQVTLCKEKSLLSHSVVSCPRDQGHRAQEEDYCLMHRLWAKPAGDSLTGPWGCTGGC